LSLVTGNRQLVTFKTLQFTVHSSLICWYTETGTNPEDVTIDKDLMDILACPVCKKKVMMEEEHIVCTGCGRKYHIKDGIPVMLADETER